MGDRTILDALMEGDLSVLDGLKTPEAPPPAPGALGYVQQFGSSLLQGAAGSTGEMLRGAGTILGAVPAVDGGPSFPQAAYDVNEALPTTMEESAKAIIPSVPGAEGSFLADKLPRTIGGMAPYLVGGEVAALSKLPPALAAAASGALASGSAGFYEAKYKGADEATQWKSFALNASVGAAQAVEIGRIFARINGASQGLLKRALVDGAVQGGIGAGTRVASNIIAQHLYDPERKVLEGAAGDGAAGFLTGVILGAATPGRKGAEEAGTGAVDAGTQDHGSATDGTRIATDAPIPGMPEPAPTVDLTGGGESMAAQEAMKGSGPILSKPAEQGKVLEGPVAEAQAPVAPGGQGQAPFSVGDEAPAPRAEAPPAPAASLPEDAAGVSRTAAPSPETKTAAPVEALTKDEWAATGIKNRTVDELTATRGMRPAEHDVSLPDEQAHGEALARMQSDPELGRRTVERFANTRETASPEDIAVLSLEARRRLNEHKTADEAYLKDPSEVNRLRSAMANEEHQKLLDVVTKLGTRQAQAFRLRQLMIAEDYSRAAMERRAKVSAKGRELTAPELEEIKTLHDRMAAAETKQSKLEERQNQIEFDRYLDKIASDAQREARKPQRRTRNIEIDKEIDTLVRGIGRKLSLTTGSGGANIAEVVGDIAKVAKLFIEKGTLKFAEFRDAMTAALGDSVRPHLTTAWEQARTEHRNELLGPAIEKMRAGEPAPLKKIAQTFAERGVQRAEIVDAVHRAIAEHAPEITREQVVKEMQAERLRSAKTRAKSGTEELKQRTEAGDFAKRTPEELHIDTELRKLRVERERARQEYETANERRRLEQRTTSERVQDAAVRLRRAWILSSPNVVAKLTSAGLERMIFTPTEEMIGTGIHAAFPKLGAKAAREGRISIRAEARAVTKAMTSGMRDAWENLHNRRSEIEILYGRPETMPRSVLEWFGSMHSALKAPTKRNEFARSFQKLAEWMIRNGIDPTTPEAQLRLGTDAYKEANRSIFLNDNRVVDAYKRAIGALKAPNKATGHPSAGGKALATAAEIVLPIVRVPTNIVAETLNYSLGLLPGGVKLAKAYKNGIENLKPEQADEIMRHLKKGSVGGAVMLLGYFGAGSIGGYYQRGKRDEKDVGFGSIRVFGHDIPSVLLHNPLLETLQIGATIRRVAEHKVKGEEQGLDEGVAAATLGLLEQVPFVRESVDMSRGFEGPGAASRVARDTTGDLVVPQAVSWVARTLDKDANGDKVKRRSTSMWEAIMERIPGLRERLPVKK